MHGRERTWSLSLLVVAVGALAAGGYLVVTRTQAGAALGQAVLAFAASVRWLLDLTLLPANASPWLLLVFGGVVTLAAVSLALLVGRALPLDATMPAEPTPRRVETTLRLPPRPETPDAYRGPRDQEFDRGRTAGAAVRADDLDGVFDLMVETELGEPRVLRCMPNLLKVRLHGCRGCSGQADVCAFECGFLEAAFTRLFRKSVVVHEVRCRGRGAEACDFEVWS